MKGIKKMCQRAEMQLEALESLQGAYLREIFEFEEV